MCHIHLPLSSGPPGAPARLAHMRIHALAPCRGRLPNSRQCQHSPRERTSQDGGTHPCMCIRLPHRAIWTASHSLSFLTVRRPRVSHHRSVRVSSVTTRHSAAQWSARSPHGTLQRNGGTPTCTRLSDGAPLVPRGVFGNRRFPRGVHFYRCRCGWRGAGHNERKSFGNFYHSNPYDNTPSGERVSLLPSEGEALVSGFSEFTPTTDCDSPADRQPASSQVRERAAILEGKKQDV